MEIKEVTRYKFDGKEYDSLAKIKIEVSNRIGAIIDKMDVRLAPKQALNLMQLIVDNKRELYQLLDVTFTIEGESFGRDQVKNILDL